MWLTIYPKMDQKTFIPFSDFRSKNYKKTAKKEKTVQEIIEHAEEIRKVNQGIHEGVMKDGAI